LARCLKNNFVTCLTLAWLATAAHLQLSIVQVLTLPDCRIHFLYFFVTRTKVWDNSLISWRTKQPMLTLESPAVFHNVPVTITLTMFARYRYVASSPNVPLFAERIGPSDLRSLRSQLDSLFSRSTVLPVIFFL